MDWESGLLYWERARKVKRGFSREVALLLSKPTEPETRRTRIGMGSQRDGNGGGISCIGVLARRCRTISLILEEASLIFWRAVSAKLVRRGVVVGVGVGVGVDEEGGWWRKGV